MPLYEYECDACGARTEKMRKLSERTDGPACPECGAATALALSVPGRASVTSGASAAPLPVNPGGCGPGGCGVSFN